MSQINEYLRHIVQHDASDLHVIAGQPPRQRVHGALQAMNVEPNNAEKTQEILYEIMPAKAKKDFEANDSADFAHHVEGLARFRVNVFRHLHGMGGVLRVIPSQAVSLKDLGMPTVLSQLCQQSQGLILVTGKTGSGKSTTLAAMIDEINGRLNGHIVTIEDPIEFVHEKKGCLISQREVGLHTPSFAEALRSGLREDPDVILVGEMRDLETISIAVTAAEMGILVMGTLHTNGAAPTVDRIVNVFPPDKQAHVRTMLATSIRGVVSQQLIPRKDKTGRVAALEILINTPAVGNLIRQGKIDQLETAMQGARQLGMITMDSSLRDLFDKSQITGQDAYHACNDKRKFEPYKTMT
jgi:twitching motility protein PilT